MGDRSVKTANMFGHPIPSQVVAIIKRLEDAGHPSYLVGGCVRDALLGIPPQDFDVATAATPPEVCDLLCDCKIIPTGIKHGTLTVISNGVQAELTTFRREGRYTDHRHPDGVEFTRLPEEDAARRDFTVNAMFYNPERGLLDFYQGSKHLASRLLCAVGDPVTRFEEDALRIIRAMRFSSVLGFNIEEKTSAAMREKAHLIKELAVERVLHELKLLFHGENAFSIIKEYSNILSHVLGVGNASAPLERYDKEYRLPVFFAYYGGSVEGAVACIKRLKPDNKTLNSVISASTALYGDGFCDRASLARAVRRFGIHNAELMCSVLKSRGLLDVSIAAYMDELKCGRCPIELRELDISGNDLEQQGLAFSKDIGTVLELLYDCVHNGSVNKKHILIEIARKYVSQKFDLKKGQL